jgi:hypothetical protein
VIFCSYSSSFNLHLLALISRAFTWAVFSSVTSDNKLVSLGHFPFLQFAQHAWLDFSNRLSPLKFKRMFRMPLDER